MAGFSTRPTYPGPGLREADPGGAIEDLADIRGWTYEACKRAIDVVGSLLLLVVTSPLMIAVAVAIRSTSRGRSLFRQRRLGRRGEEFWCYKFRTMVPDAEGLLARRPELREQFEANYKLEDDPRVTPFGAILRRTSLDELPQLWNVLRGEMSLIGPRPIIPPELSKYGGHADELLRVKPGLGGIWQVCGRSSTTYADRVAMDVSYVERRGFWLDLRLIVLTAFVVVRGRGAC